MALGRILEIPRDLHPQTRLAETLVENRSRIARVERNTSPIRTAFPFAAGWSNYGGVFAPCSFYMDRGRLYFEGLAACSTTSGLIGTLPLGFRPTTGRMIMSAQSSLSVSLRVDVDPDGSVLASAAAAGHWVNFTDMSFRV